MDSTSWYYSCFSICLNSAIRKQGLIRPAWAQKGFYYVFKRIRTEAE
jgi:hypothetical protein